MADTTPREARALSRFAEGAMDRLKALKGSGATAPFVLRAWRLMVWLAVSIALSVFLPIAAGAMPASIETAEDALHQSSVRAPRRVVVQAPSVPRAERLIRVVSVASLRRARPEGSRLPARIHLRKVPSTVPDSLADAPDQ